MESVKTRALIIRTTDYGEANRSIKIFTPDLGIVRATVYGAHSRKKSLGGESRVFSLCSLVLTRGRGGIMRAEQISVEEGFYPLSEDIVKLSAAVYFADLAEACIGFGNSDEGVLRLLLNTLWAMCYAGVPAERARAVYQLRLAAAGGWEAALGACISCGAADGAMYFDSERGGLLCKSCRRPSSAPLPPAVLVAMRGILAAKDKKIFAFRAEEAVTDTVAELSEKYLLGRIERTPASIAYYKNIR